MTRVTLRIVGREDADATKYANEKTNLNPFPFPCTNRRPININVRVKIIRLLESFLHDTGQTQFFKQNKKSKEIRKRKIVLKLRHWL